MVQSYHYLNPYGKFSELAFDFRIVTIEISGILTSIEESWNALDREVAYDFYTDPVNQDLRLQLPIEKCLLFYKTKLEDAEKETGCTFDDFSFAPWTLCDFPEAEFCVGGFLCRLC